MLDSVYLTYRGIRLAQGRPAANSILGDQAGQSARSELPLAVKPEHVPRACGLRSPRGPVSQSQAGQTAPKPLFQGTESQARSAEPHAPKCAGRPIRRCWVQGERVDFFRRISHPVHGERAEARLRPSVQDGIHVSRISRIPSNQLLARSSQNVAIRGHRLGRGGKQRSVRRGKLRECIMQIQRRRHPRPSIARFGFHPRTAIAKAPPTRVLGYHLRQQAHQGERILRH